MSVLARRGTFAAAILVLALCLWSSGAPSVLYPVYASRWDLTPLTITAVFATYPLALLVMLLVAGGLPDVIGRRRSMLAGIALIGLGAVAFAVARDVSLLFVGRALQGVGAGLAMGAASASVVETSPFASPRAAGAVTTVATSGGLTLALVLGGALAQLLPLPLVLVHVVLAVLAVGALVLVALTPDDRAATGRFRPQLPRVAPGTGGAVTTATLGVVVAYCVGGVFMALGAQMARQLTGTTDLLVVGLLLGLSSAAIGCTALVIARVPPVVSSAVGAAVSLVALAPMVATAATGTMAAFLVWCLASGVGYSFCFTGGVGLVGKEAPASHRAGTFSLVYLAAYLLQTIVSVGAGALATARGLPIAIDGAAVVVGVFCIALLGSSLAGIRDQRHPAGARTPRR